MTETNDMAAVDRPYEPPQVESVLTAEELTREIQYAGTDISAN